MSSRDIPSQMPEIIALDDIERRNSTNSETLDGIHDVLETFDKKYV